MKKKIMIALGAVLVVVIAIIVVIKFSGFGSRPEGTADIMELSEVSGLVTEKGYTQEEIIVITKPEQVTIPPELVIVCNGEQITALKGTYSWEYKNEDGTCTGIEADSMHPLESKEYMSELPLAYSCISAIDAFKAYLQFDIAPDDIEIRYWSTDCWNEFTAESKELDIQAETGLEDGMNTTSHSAKLLEGNYIYEVIAKWSSSEEYGNSTLQFLYCDGKLRTYSG